MCLCVGLSSLFLLLPFYYLLRLGRHQHYGVCVRVCCAFGHDTLHKLQEKTPVGSVVFDKQFWPTTNALDELHRHDEWLNIQEHSFSIKKNGQ